MIYIDTSSLLKTFWEEPESASVGLAIAREKIVVISSLTELEAEVQLRARWLGGDLSQSRYRVYRAIFHSYREMAPYAFRGLSGGVFDRAAKQHIEEKALHCRTLDRLHLAAMAELRIRRLLTNDGKQAAAAAALGYEIISPEADPG